MVEARFPPPGRTGIAGDAAANVPSDFVAMGCYIGPRGPLTIASSEDDRAIWVGDGPLPPLTLPWGPADHLGAPGAFARASAGIGSTTGGLDLEVRLEVSGRRLPHPSVRIDTDTSTFVLYRPVLRGPRLERHGMLVADRFGGARVRVSSRLDDIDAVVVALAWASLLSMLARPGIASVVDAVPEAP
jgi:hypothetical protein